MQECHFNELTQELSAGIHAVLPESTPEEARQKVREALDRMQQQDKILSLAPDEFRLLQDYRAWKSSADAAAGVFAWRPSPERG